jgi:predicted nucleic acid-binding protein
MSVSPSGVAESYIFNASPIIALGRLRQLDWLRHLGPRLVIPAAILRELEAGDARDGVATLIKQTLLLRVLDDIAVPPPVAEWKLDAGEEQVIAQALVEEGAVVVLDDLAARRCARALGLRMVGTVGLIAVLVRRGVIPRATPVLHGLRDKGFRISTALIDQVGRELGETES